MLRFRQRNTTIIGDIRKMYNSIDIMLNDQMTHLFLWKDIMTDKEPDTCAITVVNLGDKPSAAIALTALRKTTDMGEGISINAKDVIKDDCYMDGIIISADTIGEAKKFCKDIDGTLDSGGFEIKEWVVTGEGATSNDGFRVLGMEWDANKDIFIFKTNIRFTEKGENGYKDITPVVKRIETLNYVPSILTKRHRLSQVIRIYDPLGLLAPFTVKLQLNYS